MKNLSALSPGQILITEWIRILTDPAVVRHIIYPDQKRVDQCYTVHCSVDETLTAKKLDEALVEGLIEVLKQQRNAYNKAKKTSKRVSAKRNKRTTARSK